MTTWTQCWCNCWLCGHGVCPVIYHTDMVSVWSMTMRHGVSVVNDYADTIKSMQTLLENIVGFSVLTDFKGRIRWNKVLRCVYKPNSNNLKIWKPPYLKKNLLVHIVVDYTDTLFSNFAIKYLHENKKVRETVFACSYGYGAQVESFKQKNNGRKSCDTVPDKCEKCLRVCYDRICV